MLKLAFALLPTLWRYAILGGIIYLLGQSWGWHNLNQLGSEIIWIAQGFAFEAGLPVRDITAWLTWMFSWFPESWPTWVRVLCLLFPLSALKDYRVRYAA